MTAAILPEPQMQQTTDCNNSQKLPCFVFLRDMVAKQAARPEITSEFPLQLFPLFAPNACHPLPAFLPACLLACLFVCLPPLACLLVCLLVSLFPPNDSHPFLACLLACLLVNLLATPCFFACLPTCTLLPFQMDEAPCLWGLDCLMDWGEV